MTRVWFLAGAGIFHFATVSSWLSAPPSLLSSGYQGLFPWGKVNGAETDDTSPSSAEVKSAWSYTFTPLYVLMGWCLIKQKDNFLTFFVIFITLFSVSLVTTHFTSSVANGGDSWQRVVLKCGWAEGWQSVSLKTNMKCYSGPQTSVNSLEHCKQQKICWG
jgi:hypothetical protein